MDNKAYASSVDGSKFTCNRCGLALEDKRITLRYLDHTFSVVAPCCPRCGQTYIPEDLARGKMAQVEAELEDK